MSACPLAFEKFKLEPTEYFRIRHDTTDGYCQDTAGWQDGFSGIEPKPKPSALLPYAFSFLYITS